MKNKSEQFNMVIAGTGGQGLITLLQIILEAAAMEGKEVRSSELHGLSQRGGSVEVFARFGKKIYSPLVAKGEADFILGLEMQEALRKAVFANPNTKFLVNKQIIPIPLVKNLTEKEVVDNLKKISKTIEVVPAEEICQKELGNSVVAGIYLISLAAHKGFIPLNPESILSAIKKLIPEKYLDLNIRAFELSKRAGYGI